MEKSYPQSKRFGQRGEHLVMIQLLLVMLFVISPVWPDFRNSECFIQFALVRRGALLFGTLGGAMLGIGGTIGIRRYLTPLPWPVDHNRLVVSGVYALVRHPLYTAQLLVAAGWSINKLSISHLIITLAATLFFNHKATKEETWLTGKHSEYRDYAKRVGKLLPGLGKTKR
jgi:protein-S-isoprenylcysteine O-methyltransferase Ste14